MNTIIIPTDFSPVADNAIQYGAKLAQHLNATVILTHIYQIPVTMIDMPVGMITADELKTNSDEMLAQSEQELLKNFPELNVKTENRLGDVNDELNYLCEHNEPFAIVMGVDEVSGFERMLFGNTTLSFMRNTKYPVIAVPHNYTGFGVKKITLASDLQFSDKVPVDKIIALVQKLGAQLHVVHITEKEDEISLDFSHRLLQRLQPASPTFHTILNEHVKDGLFQYLDASPTDLLMLLPHEHNLIERLFFKMHTEDIMMHSPVPVISLKC